MTGFSTFQSGLIRQLNALHQAAVILRYMYRPNTLLIRSLKMLRSTRPSKEELIVCESSLVKARTAGTCFLRSMAATRAPWLSVDPWKVVDFLLHTRGRVCWAELYAYLLLERKFTDRKLHGSNPTPLPLDFSCPGLGNLAVSQPSCFLRVVLTEDSAESLVCDILQLNVPYTSHLVFQLARYSRYRGYKGN
ncbi:hypothetical protein T265_01056 [Opisthorchis viverrini]|uniref:Uncharacterized protein n=1 Tax=Opisthorchis viverrini TaxID=6198 RepID=A0A075AJ89_OPIVI|nr:hypothetical protein T265_01056 [Opisthorchis viverrini]KER32964.1 hypothetical protein T265_01056 [Opisthorchis viverrini]